MRLTSVTTAEFYTALHDLQASLQQLLDMPDLDIKVLNAADIHRFVYKNGNSNRKPVTQSKFCGLLT